MELLSMNGLESAKAAHLCYVTDQMPGIRREKRGEHFVYFALDGSQIEDEKDLARIKVLAVPPAYSHVWICPIVNGHIQATARDARGRKQYRYHKRWAEMRDENKYERMIPFAQTCRRFANDSKQIFPCQSFRAKKYWRRSFSSWKPPRSASATMNMPRKTIPTA